MGAVEVKQRAIDATHGRWPWAAAALSAPSLALAWSQRDHLAENSNWALWLPLPVYFLHQTEEWVKPGGFLPWCNHQLLGSDEDEYPITRRVGFWINVGFGWGSVLAGVAAGTKRPAVGIMVLSSLGGNAAMHIAKAVSGKRYNPGSGTSVLLLGPIAIAGVSSLARRPGVSKRSVVAGVASGIATAFLMFGSMKVRLKRERRSQ